MGLLDFLFDKEKAAERKLAKAQKKVTNMYLQAPERQYVFSELRDTGTSEAVWILLQRYNENNPNTTLDIEEKQLVFDMLISMSRDADADVIGQLKRYIVEREEKINWPMKVLARLLPHDEYVSFIADILRSCDTEYQRTVEKKQELMLRSTEIKSAELAEVITRFLADENETIRFLTFDAIFHQDGTEDIARAIFEQLVEEESIRIIQKAVPAVTGRHDLPVPEDLREQVDAWLDDDYGVHRDGYVYEHRR